VSNNRWAKTKTGMHRLRELLFDARNTHYKNASRGPSAIAEVLVLTDARLSRDAQPNFISIRQVAAASFTVEDWTECAQTHKSENSISAIFTPFTWRI